MAAGRSTRTLGVSFNPRDMQSNTPPELPSDPEKPGFWRAAFELCFAIDAVYIAVVVVLCAGAIVFALVTFDAEILVLAGVGILTAFVLGCLMLGIRGIDRNR